MRSLLLVLVSALSISAQPYIAYRGVVNAASSTTPGLPSGGIARGSTFSTYGRRLGPASSPALSFPLSTTLGGVSITITQGTTTVNAIPTFVSAGQINAIMPSNAPLGLATMRVTFNNARSNVTPVRIVNASVGLFSASGAGTGPGIFQNYIAATQQPINALNVSATRGQVITLWGTGLGPVAADNVAPTPGNLPTSLELFVGGIAAPVQYSGRSPCCAGIDQIVFTVPADAPLGCWVPVYVKTERAVVSNFVTMAITNGSNSCDEPNTSIAQTLAHGGRSASFLAARFSIREDVGVPQPIDATTDVIGGYMVEQKAGPFNFNPLLSLPPAGTCTAYGINGNVAQRVPFLAGMLPTGRGLDPGVLTISGAKGIKTVPSAPPFGIAMSYLGSGLSSFQQLVNLFLDPGGFKVSGTGGPDIGGFSASIDMPQGLNWTNRDQLTTITRAQGATINWTGAASGNSVFISGVGIDVPTNSTGLFVCQAAPGASSFRVPPDILANIAPARARTNQSIGAIYIGQWPLASPVTFSASGLDAGALLAAQVSAKTVVFK